MAFVNYDNKEINAKVVYFGAQGSGKTSNLRSLYQNLSQEMRDGLLKLGPEDDLPHFYEFLPLSLGKVDQFHVKLHLYTMPSDAVYETLTSVLLKGVDGFVFVADSQVAKMVDNIEAQTLTYAHLEEEGYCIADLPHVIQYNKRDREQKAPVAIMRKELNDYNSPDIECIANEDVGTMESLVSVSKQILRKLAPVV